MENNNYSGADIEQLIKNSGLKKTAIAEMLNWDYMKLHRVFKREKNKLSQVRPILDLLGVFDEGIDYKKEYFLIKEKYEKLLLTLKIKTESTGTKSGQIIQKTNKNNIAKGSKTTG